MTHQKPSRDPENVKPSPPSDVAETLAPAEEDDIPVTGDDDAPLAVEPEEEIDEVPPSDDDVSIRRTDPQDDGAPHRIQLVIRRRLPGRRLDKYLHGRFRKLSRTTIQRMI